MIPSYSDDGQMIEGVDLSGVDRPPKLPPSRVDLYSHFVKENLFPTVLGKDPRLDPMLQMGSNYPATILIHGTADRIVPCECSRQVKSKLGANGVTCHLIEVPGKDHGFEQFATIPQVAPTGDGVHHTGTLWNRCLGPAWALVDEAMGCKGGI